MPEPNPKAEVVSVSRVSRPIVQLARIVAGAIREAAKATGEGNSVDYNPDPLDRAVGSMRAHLAVLEKAQGTMHRYIGLASSGEVGRLALNEKMRQAYEAAAKVSEETGNARSALRSCYQSMGEGRQVVVAGDTKQERGVADATVLRQLMALRQRFPGNFHYGFNPLRVTVVTPPTRVEARPRGKLRAAITFGPFHVHFFPGASAAHCVVPIVVPGGGSPDYTDPKLVGDPKEVTIWNGGYARLPGHGLTSRVKAPMCRGGLARAHPHIMPDGHLCQGNSGTVISMALAEGRVMDVIDYALQVLKEPHYLNEKEHMGDYEITQWPHCEVPCYICKKIDGTKMIDEGNFGKIHERCIMRRCPDTGLPLLDSEHGTPLNYISVDGVDIHTSGQRLGPGGRRLRLALIPKTSITGREITGITRNGTCCVTGIRGLSYREGAGMYLSHPDDLLELPDGRLVSAAALDLIPDPFHKESPDGETNEAAATVPTPATRQWWYQKWNAYPQYWSNEDTDAVGRTYYLALERGAHRNSYDNEYRRAIAAKAPKAPKA